MERFNGPASVVSAAYREIGMKLDLRNPYVFWPRNC